MNCFLVTKVAWVRVPLCSFGDLNILKCAFFLVPNFWCFYLKKLKSELINEVLDLFFFLIILFSTDLVFNIPNRKLLEEYLRYINKYVLIIIIILFFDLILNYLKTIP